MANTHSTTLVKASNQSWNCPDHSSLDLTTTATWEFYIKPSSAISSGGLWGLITKDDISTQRSYAIDYYNNSGTRLLRIGVTSNGASTYEENSLAYTLPVSTWTHIAITYKGSNSYGSRFEFFVNGVSQGNGAVAGSGVASICNG